MGAKVKIKDISGLDAALAAKYGVPATATVLSGTELTFDVLNKKYTKYITSNQTLSLAASGNVADSFIIITTTGDGSHLLSFPATWIMSGDAYSATRKQEILFRYTGTYVLGVITSLEFIPILLSASVENASPSILNLGTSLAVIITTAGWSVSASGGAVTVSSVASGSGTIAPKLNLSRSIASTEIVTVSYDQSTGATLDTNGNELITLIAFAVTNNVVGINLEVLFTGTTIDTAKGTVTNPDVANLTISQNNKLIFTRTTDTAIASTLVNYWRSVNTYTRGTFAVLFNKDAGFATSAASFQYRVDANNDIAILKKANSATEVTLRVRVSAATVYTLDVTVSQNSRFKIAYNSLNEIRFYYYSSGWIQIGTTQTYNVGSSANIQLATNSESADAPADAFSFDTLYVTDKEYTTVTP
jgi:hypothetical protein